MFLTITRSAIAMCRNSRHTNITKRTKLYFSSTNQNAGDMRFDKKKMLIFQETIFEPHSKVGERNRAYLCIRKRSPSLPSNRTRASPSRAMLRQADVGLKQTNEA